MKTTDSYMKLNTVWGIVHSCSLYVCSISGALVSLSSVNRVIHQLPVNVMPPWFFSSCARPRLDQHQPRGPDLWWVLFGPPELRATHLHRQAPETQRVAPCAAAGEEGDSRKWITPLPRHSPFCSFSRCCQMFWREDFSLLSNNNTNYLNWLKSWGCFIILQNRDII